MNYLDGLEAESIHILREAAACFENPVLLYSISKESSVLTCKTFAPGRSSRFVMRRFGLIVHVNENGLRGGIDPVRSGSALHTDVMKERGFAPEAKRFDAAIGGRDAGVPAFRVDRTLTSGTLWRMSRSHRSALLRKKAAGCPQARNAIESRAAQLEDIIAEMRKSRSSERQDRLIDGGQAASMEKKKQEGYF